MEEKESFFIRRPFITDRFLKWAAILMLSIIIAGIFFILYAEKPIVHSEDLVQILLTIAGGLLAIVVPQLLLRYLNRPIISYALEQARRNAKNKIPKIEIDEIVKQIKNARASDTTTTDAILKSLIEQLTKETDKKPVSREWKRLDPEHERASYFADINYSFLINRLSEEINQLIRRGNLSLTIGITVAGIGLLILGSYLIITDFFINRPDSLKEIVYHLSRLTLVIFTELVAYFFLKLYKTSLNDIKYYQNEITNLQAKRIALLTAIQCNNSALVEKIILEVAATERNMTFDKNQTTIELEKLRIEGSNVGKIARVIQTVSESLRSNKVQ